MANNDQPTNFYPIDLEKLKELILKLKLSTSPADSMPTSLFREVLGVIGPAVLTIINSSLSSGVIPSCLKHSVIRPFLKKPNLDPSDFSHFRPISTLPFLSKVLEKIVSLQLSAFLTDHNIHDCFQQGLGLVIAPTWLFLKCQKSSCTLWILVTLLF